MPADSLNGVQVTWESGLTALFILVEERLFVQHLSMHIYFYQHLKERRNSLLSFNESKILKKNMFISVEPRHFILNLQNEVD